MYTPGFDPPRGVGVGYAHKSKEARNEIARRHYDGMTHGWLQMTAWSDKVKDAVKDVATDLKKFTYG
jgi:acetyl esterase/lipase